jgi:hypothetical protein
VLLFFPSYLIPWFLSSSLWHHISQVDSSAVRARCFVARRVFAVDFSLHCVLACARCGFVSESKSILVVVVVVAAIPGRVDNRSDFDAHCPTRVARSVRRRLFGIVLGIILIIILFLIVKFVIRIFIRCILCIHRCGRLGEFRALAAARAGRGRRQGGARAQSGRNDGCDWRGGAAAGGCGGRCRGRCRGWQRWCWRCVRGRQSRHATDWYPQLPLFFVVFRFSRVSIAHTRTLDLPVEIIHFSFLFYFLD